MYEDVCTNLLLFNNQIDLTSSQAREAHRATLFTCPGVSIYLPSSFPGLLYTPSSSPSLPPRKPMLNPRPLGSHRKSLPQPWSTFPDTHDCPAPKLRPSMPTHPRAPQNPAGHDWAHIYPQICSCSSSSMFSISICGSTHSPPPEAWSHPQHLPVPHSPTADQSQVLSALPSAF